jgi:hypothetical protein
MWSVSNCGFACIFGGETPEALGEALMGVADDATRTLANMSPRKRKAEEL